MTLISRADAICEVLVNDGIDNIVDRINALPSAVCDDCIWTVCNYNKTDWDAPSADAVEVVRCKNCKDSRVYGKTTQWLACESVMEGQATDPDGYCYLGERREESEVEG